MSAVLIMAKGLITIYSDNGMKHKILWTDEFVCFISFSKMTTDRQKDFLTGHQGLGERTKADPEYNGRMTFANSGPKNLALSGEEKATTEPNGGPMLRPSPCSGPIQADYDYDYII